MLLAGPPSHDISSIGRKTSQCLHSFSDEEQDRCLKHRLGS